MTSSAVEERLPRSRERRAEQKSRATKNPPMVKSVGLDEAPGSDLLSHGLSHTTIGAGAFHFRVRDGIGWDHAAVSAREAVQVARLRGLRIGLGRNKVSLSLEDVPSRNWSFESQCCALAGKATWSYMIKPLGSLVSVSSALLRYTPDLSTT